MDKGSEYRERCVEQRLKTKIQKIKGLCIKLLTPYVNGLPDRLCVLPGGRVIFVETKAPGRYLRPSQRVIRRKLEGLGFKVEVITTKEEVDEFIKRISEEMYRIYREP